MAVICFKVPSNKSDINFLDSKELDDLSFSISPTNSICKACLASVNKRLNGEASKNGLICELDNTITNVHEIALNAIGIPIKVKRNVVRKLGFESTCDKTFMPATFSVNSTLSSTSEIGCLDKLQAFNSLTVCTNDKNFLVRLDMCLIVGYIYIVRVYFIAQSPAPPWNILISAK